jgi:hypothetical protein
MRIAALLLLTTLAIAGEPDSSKERRPITANLENVGPETASRMLKEAVGLKVEIAPQLAVYKANLRLVGVPTHLAMKELGEHFHCEVRFLGKKRWHLAPKWQFDILDKLDTRMDGAPKFKKQPIGSVLEMIRKGAGVDITLDKTVDRALTVSLPAKKWTYRKLLDQVAKKAKLKWELRYGVVYVASKERLKQLPVLVPELRKHEERARLLGLKLDAVPLKKVGAKIGVDLRLPEEQADLEITARAKEITLAQALALMLYPQGLTATEKNGGLAVEKLPAR